MRIIKLGGLLFNQQWFQKERIEKNEKITKAIKQEKFTEMRHESLNLRNLPNNKKN